MIEKDISSILETITAIIRKEYKPEKIILYGSYAYGNPTKHSDIDLFIVKRTDKKRVDRYVEVKEMIYDSKRRISISPLVYTPQEIKERLVIGDDFVKEILDRGRIIYGE